MTIIIHPVGNGDLGNDIVNLSHEERLTMQAERLRELQEIIDEAEPKDLAEHSIRAIMQNRWSAMWNCLLGRNLIIRTR